MKFFLIAFVCLIVIAKVASKVAPTSGKVLRGTSTELSKSEWILKNIKNYLDECLRKIERVGAKVKEEKNIKIFMMNLTKWWKSIMKIILFSMLNGLDRNVHI